MWLRLMCPLLGTWPATQACALTGNQTSNPLVCRLALNPLSHTSQGKILSFLGHKLTVSSLLYSGILTFGLSRASQSLDTVNNLPMSMPFKYKQTNSELIPLFTSFMRFSHSGLLSTSSTYLRGGHQTSRDSQFAPGTIEIIPPSQS